MKHPFVLEVLCMYSCPSFIFENEIANVKLKQIVLFALTPLRSLIHFQNRLFYHISIKTMVDSIHEELLPRPIQEEGQQKTAEKLKMLAEFLQKNRDVLTNLLQTQGRGIAERSKFHLNTSALAAMACGSWSWIRFWIFFLWTAFTDGLKTMKEIPKESRAQLDKMKKHLGEVKWNLEKVLYDTTKMQEKVLLVFFVFLFYL